MTNFNPMYQNGMNMQNNIASMPYYNNYQPNYLERLERLSQQQTQQPIQPQTNVNWVQVTNIQQAKEQIVQPNNTVWMMDSSLPRIYVKSVSSVGKIDFQPYELVALDENGNLPNQQMQVSQQQMVDNQNYVHVEEFNKLTQIVNELNQKVAMYEQLLQGQQNVGTTKTTGRRGGSANATESSK